MRFDVETMKREILRLASFRAWDIIEFRKLTPDEWAVKAAELREALDKTPDRFIPALYGAIDQQRAWGRERDFNGNLSDYIAIRESWPPHTPTEEPASV